MKLRRGFFTVGKETHENNLEHMELLARLGDFYGVKSTKATVASLASDSTPVDVPEVRTEVILASGKDDTKEPPESGTWSDCYYCKYGAPYGSCPGDGYGSCECR
jgi:hypothetical protein